MLVDDEKWVRTTIKSVLPLETLDLVLAGEAANGVEAFELALKLAPDILLTDIKMPGMNGIELIAKLKEPLPHLKAIIISGYDEFEYAKKALQLGAVDYLLKPVDEQNVTAVLSQVKKHILEERERLEREKLLKTHYHMSLPLVQERFLNELIKGHHYSYADIKERVNDFDLKFENNHFEVLVISIDNYVTKIKNAASDNRQVILEQMEALLNRFAKKHLHGRAFSSNQMENELIIIANPQTPRTPEYTRNLLATIQKIIIRRLNITFSTGVSSGMTGYQNLNRLYGEAVDALKYKMLYGKCSIIFFDEVRNSRVTEFYFSKDIVNEMVLNIELLNEPNLATIIDALFEQINRYRETTPELIKTSIWRLIIDIVTAINCPSFPACILYEFGDASLYEDFKKIDTLPDMSEYLKKVCRLIMNDYLKKERSSSRNVIETAKSYIDHHFNQEITLELIANYVFVNPTYFSELFKKETGRNYIEYITDLRMNKAKELLSQTNLKIAEICEAVGYTDAKYFSKTFKKLTGITPSEYKMEMDKKTVN